ncbi:MAG: hypothetical protein BGN86_16975 [Caulobacterales bacterium 68-7]|nr:MAG: hypothetical protein BGN86_16975 [Caulobacterales bacterium 68-7]
MIRNLAFIAALLVTAAPVVADAQVRLPPGAFEVAQGRGRGPDGNGPPGQSRGGQVIGMERAVAIARGRAGGGQVLDASLAGANYRVRIRTPDGRVIDFIIDPQSGAILAMDGG